MSSSARSRLEVWLVVAGMLAATAWYAWPQLAYSLSSLRQLLQVVLTSFAP